jgi:hypothetical protein
VLVFLASLWDTRQKLHLERTADESFLPRLDQRGSTGV